jgi:hypothetical protein
MSCLSFFVCVVFQYLLRTCVHDLLKKKLACMYVAAKRYIGYTPSLADLEFYVRVGQVGIFSLNARNITFQCIDIICLKPKQEIIRSHKDHKFNVRGLIVFVVLFENMTHFLSYFYSSASLECTSSTLKNNSSYSPITLKSYTFTDR